MLRNYPGINMSCSYFPGINKLSVGGNANPANSHAAVESLWNQLITRKTRILNSIESIKYKTGPDFFLGGKPESHRNVHENRIDDADQGPHKEGQQPPSEKKEEQQPDQPDRVIGAQRAVRQKMPQNV